MEKFLGGCFFLFVAGYLVVSFIAHFSGILTLLLVLSIVHYLYILRIMRFGEAKGAGKIGKLDDVRQGVETRMWVSFLYLLFFDFVFYHASEVVGKDRYDMLILSRNVDGTEAGVFILMVIFGIFVSAYCVFSMMQENHQASEVKKYLLALSVASVSGGVLGFVLITKQYLVLPFSSSSVMVFSLKSVASTVAYSYVVASFFSARYSCQSGDIADVYFLGMRLYRVGGHGDVVVPILSLSLQLLLDLIKQHYLFFSVDWVGVRQPLVHQAPNRTVRVEVEGTPPPAPKMSVPRPAPSPTPSGPGAPQRRVPEPHEYVHPFEKMKRGGGQSGQSEGGERNPSPKARVPAPPPTTQTKEPKHPYVASQLAREAAERERGQGGNVDIVVPAVQSVTPSGASGQVQDDDARLQAEIVHGVHGANVASFAAARQARAVSANR